MFKKSLLVLSLISLSGSVLSAPVANLKINGAITPPTCTVNGEENVDISYAFDVAPGLFPATGNLMLDEQIKNIEVVCDAKTYLAFDISDERTSSVLIAGATNFGLGLYGESTNVGFYTVTASNMTTKDTPESIAKTAYLQIGNAALVARPTLNHTLKSSWVTTKDILASGTVFSADLAVKPTLNGVLKNSDGTAKLDGHAILTFSFGL